AIWRTRCPRFAGPPTARRVPLMRWRAVTAHAARCSAGHHGNVFCCADAGCEIRDAKRTDDDDSLWSNRPAFESRFIPPEVKRNAPLELGAKGVRHFTQVDPPPGTAGDVYHTFNRLVRERKTVNNRERPMCQASWLNDSDTFWSAERCSALPALLQTV